MEHFSLLRSLDKVCYSSATFHCNIPRVGGHHCWRLADGSKVARVFGVHFCLGCLVVLQGRYSLCCMSLSALSLGTSKTVHVQVHTVSLLALRSVLQLELHELMPRWQQGESMSQTVVDKPHSLINPALELRRTPQLQYCCMTG